MGGVSAAETAADDAEMVCCQTGRRPEAVHFLRDVCKNVSAAIFGTEKRQTGFQIIQMYQMLLLSGALSLRSDNAGQNFTDALCG